MGCECFQVGGPWIAEDPNCPVHGRGGLGDQLEESQTEVESLRATIKKLEDRVLKLEQGSDWGRTHCAECNTPVLVRIECKDHESDKEEE